MFKLSKGVPPVSEKIKLPTTYDEAITAIKNGWVDFTNQNVLKLTDASGWSVAHYLARRGHVFTNEAILSLKTKIGTTVKSCMGQPVF